jgi:hypothetical protein
MLPELNIFQHGTYVTFKKTLYSSKTEAKKFYMKGNYKTGLLVHTLKSPLFASKGNHGREINKIHASDTINV